MGYSETDDVSQYLLFPVFDYSRSNAEFDHIHIDITYDKGLPA